MAADTTCRGLLRVYPVSMHPSTGMHPRIRRSRWAALRTSERFATLSEMSDTATPQESAARPVADLAPTGRDRGPRGSKIEYDVVRAVKRHRGEPGHTRDTHGTRGRTKAHRRYRRAHGPHAGRTSQPSKPTNNTHPARQRDDRSRGRLNSRPLVASVVLPGVFLPGNVQVRECLELPVQVRVSRLPPVSYYR